MDAGSSSQRRAGFVAGVGAYVTWGMFPLYWKALGAVPALQVVAHRSWWSLAFVTALLAWRGGWRPLLEACRSPRVLGTYLASGLLIAVNWLIFIWAVNAGRAIECSLGYFITPLVNVALGVLVLRERLRGVQTVAIGIAVAAVALLAVSNGGVPWVALALSLSFGGYGLVRKLGGLGGLEGLWLETAFLAPAALAWILVTEARGDGALSHDGLVIDLLLLAGGAVTAIPLLWFIRAVRSLPLATIGLMQFITPTVQLALAVAAFHEPWTRAHLLAFPLIWTALALYAWDAVRVRRSDEQENTQQA
jgi:chloramphenicol-sensitive protein RarD